MIFLQLFLTFFKIGLFTFGGGYAMIPLIFEEITANYSHLLTEEDLINFIAVSESTPGPFAVNIATYIGTIAAGGSIWGGILGGICATLGVVMPSFIIILIVSKFYEKFKTNKIVNGAMTGLKPAVVGLIAYAGINIGKTVFFPNAFTFDATFYISLAIFVPMTVLALKKVHPILLICVSAVVGILSGYILGL